MTHVEHFKAQVATDAWVFAWRCPGARSINYRFRTSGVWLDVETFSLLPREQGMTVPELIAQDWRGVGTSPPVRAS